jgi:hypothetical protein
MHFLQFHSNDIAGTATCIKDVMNNVIAPNVLQTTVYGELQKTPNGMFIKKSFQADIKDFVRYLDSKCVY